MNQNCSLKGSVVLRCDVDSATTDRLYELFVTYYNHVDRDTFDKDIDEKTWILMLKDGSGKVQGFTTMMLYDFLFIGKRVRAIFSGNTIIEKEFWGGQELSRTWGQFMAKLKCELPTVPLYWFLISSGYRTYLFLPLFFKNFYPCHNKATPLYESRLIDTLGKMKFPNEYREGIVYVSEPRECLDPEFALPSDRRMRNKHVRFFVENNPDYLKGNELVCLTEFSLENNLRSAHDALHDAINQHVHFNDMKSRAL